MCLVTGQSPSKYEQARNRKQQVHTRSIHVGLLLCDDSRALEAYKVLDKVLDVHGNGGNKKCDLDRHGRGCG